MGGGGEEKDRGQIVNSLLGIQMSNVLSNYFLMSLLYLIILRLKFLSFHF